MKCYATWGKQDSQNVSKYVMKFHTKNFAFEENLALGWASFMPTSYFKPITFGSNPLQPERIYNSYYSNVVPAMFIS